MENGTYNGVRTNHDRDVRTNGVNGRDVKVKREGSPDSKAVGNGSAMVAVGGGAQGPKMEELPDELQHITTDIMPLTLLLTRLAQFSHGALQDQIIALASKPVPQNIANGNANYSSTGVEDTSPESLEKKKMLLNFIQDLHSRWVKALVITEWSKKADQVGKLIDIRTHIVSKLELFNMAFWDLVKIKQDMLWAKVPSPDLKTALEVLNFGEVRWMPEFNYLEPPPVSAEEKESWIEEINTLLSARLSIDEYDRIPEPFRDYTIHSGRVTFRVEGEFEVDLTIGEEDFEKQFWFIDFRFLFSPAPAELSERARLFLEFKVNEALATDGLPGCYNYLHEFTLTAKIGEFTRQAVELSTVRWVDTLKIERLNRSLAIQYWLNRQHSQGSKSWIILGVNSGRGTDGVRDPGSPSYISLRWFRDGKEVKDADIPFDVETISTEKLLMAVIARHIDYLLSSIYNRLLSKPRFAQKQSRLSLDTSHEEPMYHCLTMQLLGDEDVTVRIDPLTGAFALLPRSFVIHEGQRRFNSLPNPAEEGPGALEQVRCFYVIRDFRMRAKSAGWAVLRLPLSTDELKNVVYSGSPSSREPFQAVWMRKVDWDPRWFVMLSMSLDGDKWWLIEISGQQRPGIGGSRIRTFTQLPMVSSELHFSGSFFHNLASYSAGIISQISNLRELHQRRLPHAVRPSQKSKTSAAIKMPTTYVRLSDMLPPRNGSGEPASTPWAKEYIPINFLGASPSDHSYNKSGSGTPQFPGPAGTIAEARVAVTDRRRFQFLKGRLDRSVSYDPGRGEFTFRLRADMCTPSITLLAARLRSLQRMIDFVDAVRRAGRGVVPESASLHQVVFTYGSSAAEEAAGGPQEQRRWRVRLDLAKERAVDVILEKGNPHLRVADFLREVVNTPRFDSLPAWLVFTLPLYQALDRLEDEWANVVANAEGGCYVLHKSMDWVTVRFALSGANRRVNLNIRPRRRQGTLMWHVVRADSDPNAKSDNDEFNKALKQRVWTAKGDGFTGVIKGALALPEHGIGNLLALISQTVLSMVGTPQPAQPHQRQPQPHGLGQSQPQPQPQPVPQPQPQPQHQPHQPPQPAVRHGHGQQQQQQQQPQPQQQQQHPPVPPQGHPLQQVQVGRFAQPLQQQQPQQHFQHQQQQQQPQQHLQQHRPPQAQMPQPNMHGQIQHQGQAQGQRPNSGLGTSNAPVVVLD